MKNILTTIALTILLFSCKQENKNVKKTEENKETKKEEIVYKKLIENEKIEEFTATLFQGKDELEGKIELKKDGIEKPYSYTFKDIPYLDLSKAESIKMIVDFEDFNFDGEKELIIFGDNGLYVYDRKTGEPKNFFKEEKGGYALDGSKNYIFTYRGEYVKNEKEKSITITGACGAGCGSEITYLAQSDGTMKLVKECNWDY